MGLVREGNLLQVFFLLQEKNRKEEQCPSARPGEHRCPFSPSSPRGRGARRVFVALCSAARDQTGEQRFPTPNAGLII